MSDEAAREIRSWVKKLQHPDPAVAKQAASTLVTLARDKTNASLVVEQHAATHAVKALKRVKEGRDLVVPHVVKLLRVLLKAAPAKVRGILIKHHGTALLFRALRTTRAARKQFALSLVRLLNALVLHDKRAANHARKESGYVYVIRSLCTYEDHLDLVSALALLLHRLAKTSAYDALYNLRFHNGTPTLVATLHRWRASPVVVRAICNTVYETKPGGAFKQTLCEGGMVPALVSAARCHVGRTPLFLLLARTLRSFAETPRFDARLLCSGGGSFLGHALKKRTSRRATYGPIAKVLCHLCFHLVSGIRRPVIYLNRVDQAFALPPVDAAGGSEQQGEAEGKGAGVGKDGAAPSPAVDVRAAEAAAEETARAAEAVEETGPVAAEPFVAPKGGGPGRGAFEEDMSWVASGVSAPPSRQRTWRSPAWVARWELGAAPWGEFFPEWDHEELRHLVADVAAGADSATAAAAAAAAVAASPTPARRSSAAVDGAGAPNAHRGLFSHVVPRPFLPLGLPPHEEARARAQDFCVAADLAGMRDAAAQPPPPRPASNTEVVDSEDARYFDASHSVPNALAALSFLSFDRAPSTAPQGAASAAAAREARRPDAWWQAPAAGACLPFLSDLQPEEREDALAAIRTVMADGGAHFVTHAVASEVERGVPFREMARARAGIYTLSADAATVHGSFAAIFASHSGAHSGSEERRNSLGGAASTPDGSGVAAAGASSPWTSSAHSTPIGAPPPAQQAVVTVSSRLALVPPSVPTPSSAPAPPSCPAAVLAALPSQGTLAPWAAEWWCRLGPSLRAPVGADAASLDWTLFGFRGPSAPSGSALAALLPTSPRGGSTAARGPDRASPPPHSSRSPLPLRGRRLSMGARLHQGAGDDIARRGRGFTPRPTAAEEGSPRRGQSPVPGTGAASPGAGPGPSREEASLWQHCLRVDTLTARTAALASRLVGRPAQSAQERGCAWVPQPDPAAAAAAAADDDDDAVAVDGSGGSGPLGPWPLRCTRPGQRPASAGGGTPPTAGVDGSLLQALAVAVEARRIASLSPPAASSPVPTPTPTLTLPRVLAASGGGRGGDGAAEATAAPAAGDASPVPSQSGSRVAPGVGGLGMSATPPPHVAAAAMAARMAVSAAACAATKGAREALLAFADSQLRLMRCARPLPQSAPRVRKNAATHFMVQEAHSLLHDGTLRNLTEAEGVRLGIFTPPASSDEGSSGSDSDSDSDSDGEAAEEEGGSEGGAGTSPRRRPGSSPMPTARELIREAGEKVRREARLKALEARLVRRAEAEEEVRRVPEPLQQPMMQAAQLQVPCIAPPGADIVYDCLHTPPAWFWAGAPPPPLAPVFERHDKAGLEGGDEGLDPVWEGGLALAPTANPAFPSSAYAAAGWQQCRRPRGGPVDLGAATDLGSEAGRVHSWPPSRAQFVRSVPAASIALDGASAVPEGSVHVLPTTEGGQNARVVDCDGHHVLTNVEVRQGFSLAAVFGGVWGPRPPIEATAVGGATAPGGASHGGGSGSGGGNHGGSSGNHGGSSSGAQTGHDTASAVKHPLPPAPSGRGIPPLRFESRFESGNLSQAVRVDWSAYELVLCNDANARCYTQWFYFAVRGAVPGVKYRFTLVNLEKAGSLVNEGMQPLAYSLRAARERGAWWTRVGEHLCYHRNWRRKWRRPTGSGSPCYSLSFTTTFPFAEDVVYLAYSHPYTLSQGWLDLRRHLALPAATSCVRLTTLCHSLAGNACPLLTVTSPDVADSPPPWQRPYVVLTARVHPGETPASWMMKGLLDFLLSGHPTAEQLRRTYVFKLVPILNPDGVAYGNYRFNLAGLDLNRTYRLPMDQARQRCPPTHALRQLFAGLRFLGRRIVMFCDLHAHSRKKGYFMFGCQSGLASAPEKVIPTLMARKDPRFALENCHFEVTADKENAGRVAVHQDFGVIASYTMEMSFSGPNDGRTKRRSSQFTPDEMEHAGRTLLETVHALDPGTEVPRLRSGGGNGPWAVSAARRAAAALSASRVLGDEEVTMLTRAADSMEAEAEEEGGSPVSGDSSPVPLPPPIQGDASAMWADAAAAAVPDGESATLRDAARVLARRAVERGVAGAGAGSDEAGAASHELHYEDDDDGDEDDEDDGNRDEDEGESEGQRKEEEEEEEEEEVEDEDDDGDDDDEEDEDEDEDVYEDIEEDEEGAEEGEYDGPAAGAAADTSDTTTDEEGSGPDQRAGGAAHSLWTGSSHSEEGEDGRGGRSHGASGALSGAARGDDYEDYGDDYDGPRGSMLGRGRRRVPGPASVEEGDNTLDTLLRDAFHQAVAVYGQRRISRRHPPLDAGTERGSVGFPLRHRAGVRGGRQHGRRPNAGGVSYGRRNDTREQERGAAPDVAPLRLDAASFANGGAAADAAASGPQLANEPLPARSPRFRSEWQPDGDGSSAAEETPRRRAIRVQQLNFASSHPQREAPSSTRRSSDRPSDGAGAELPAAEGGSGAGMRARRHRGGASPRQQDGNGKRSASPLSPRVGGASEDAADAVPASPIARPVPVPTASPASLMSRAAEGELRRPTPLAADPHRGDAGPSSPSRGDHPTPFPITRDPASGSFLLPRDAGSDAARGRASSSAAAAAGQYIPAAARGRESGVESAQGWSSRDAAMGAAGGRTTAHAPTRSRVGPRAGMPPLSPPVARNRPRTGALRPVGPATLSAMDALVAGTQYGWRKGQGPAQESSHVAAAAVGQGRRGRQVGAAAGAAPRLAVPAPDSGARSPRGRGHRSGSAPAATGTVQHSRRRGGSSSEAPLATNTRLLSQAGQQSIGVLPRRRK